MACSMDLPCSYIAVRRNFSLTPVTIFYSSLIVVVKKKKKKKNGENRHPEYQKGLKVHAMSGKKS